MLEIKDLDKLKITRVRDWRINFRYDGVLYSLNCHSDGYESYVALTNRDKMEDVWDDYGDLYIKHYIKVKYNDYDKPCIYSHIDKEYFVKKLYKDGIIKAPEHIQKEIQKETIKDKLIRMSNNIKTKELEIEIIKSDMNKLLDEYLEIK